MATEGLVAGTLVKWAGVQDARVAPGWTGTVVRSSEKDPDSIKVFWNERGGSTWERRANLTIVIP